MLPHMHAYVEDIGERRRIIISIEAKFGKGRDRSCEEQIVS